jgi:hypothetical protein
LRDERGSKARLVQPWRSDPSDPSSLLPLVRLLYMQDHHCPWLNACVGLGNERHFVLFMLWLAFGMGVVVCTSYPLLKRSFALSTPVSHSAVSPAK